MILKRSNFTYWEPPLAPGNFFLKVRQKKSLRQKCHCDKNVPKILARLLQGKMGTKDAMKKRNDFCSKERLKIYSQISEYHKL